MTFTEQLIAVSLRYAEVLRLPLKTVSSRAFNEAKLLDRVVSEKATVTLIRAEKALGWFSENWPPGAVWPADVPRPAHSDSEAAA